MAAQLVRAAEAWYLAHSAGRRFRRPAFMDNPGQGQAHNLTLGSFVFIDSHQDQQPSSGAPLCLRSRQLIVFQVWDWIKLPARCGISPSLLLNHCFYLQKDFA